MAVRRRFGLLFILLSLIILLFIFIQSAVVGVGLYQTIEYSKKALDEKLATAQHFVNRQIAFKIGALEDIAFRVRDDLVREPDLLKQDEKFFTRFAPILTSDNYIAELKYHFPDKKYYAIRRALPFNQFAIGFDTYRDGSIVNMILPDQGQWGYLKWNMILQESGISFFVPVYDRGTYLGAIEILLPMSELSRILKDIGNVYNGEVVLIEAEGKAFPSKSHVVAHPFLAGKKMGWLSSLHPLPTIEDLGDPLLLAVGAPFGTEDDLLRDVLGGLDQSFFSVGGQSFLMVEDHLGRAPQNHFPYEKLSTIIFFPITDLVMQIQTLKEAAFVGGVGLLVGVFIIGIIIRHVTRPIIRLSQQASEISSLRVRQLEPLPTSYIREVDDASTAFNKMVVVLKWFERYIPQQLARRLVESGDQWAFRSIKREATVLFTDLSGFTQYSENLSPEEVSAYLNHHFYILSQVIHDHGGMIDKYIGDSVMAVWSVPDYQEDHAALAVKAALAIREAVEDMFIDKTQYVRIGIHTGPVIAGNIGGKDRLNYTVIGDAVNVASRIEQFGKNHRNMESSTTILCSEETLASLQEPIQLEAKRIGDCALSGRTQNMTIYRL